ncbi:methyltransferase (TIGR00027 family) [Amycolatopsis bartoniae]|uniref:S-adenosyl-L-methionine-dependent methyltransferase n=1 Tax=Amycolatopsis bartoniae TaxID=941986 RepID=A0A8H9IZW4_9PSEU|nr:SAM-dependent methyltransferase [Amycolatopsis bartoniae]MBB2935222.1 methyltransferase (TIGR00027 family) [Amycolatopsis bartoniae]TVT04069.1 SAM-dependent methyltransferase [Amycolatopsis bartoniae]GHF75200.1 putative S-adenosyl-L-methionine-dependent methyltransferase [Amycolatopsis bartoniae]
MQDWDIVSGIGITALAVAAARAVESSRDEPLVSDPYAVAFVEAADSPIPLPRRAGDLPRDDDLWERMSLFVGLRSRFFDEYLLEAMTAGVRQVVVLAAGLDARAFRLDLPPETTLYEVDQPRVLEFKDSVLDAQPRCERRTVAVDLRNDWAGALGDAGFDPEQPTAWLVEGLLPYLSRDASAQLLDTLHTLSAPGSTVAIEYVHDPKAALEDPAVRNLLREFGFDYAALLPEDPHGDPGEQLSAAGWTVSAVSGADLAERYGRTPLDDGASMFGANDRYLTGRFG